ncbi:3'-5' DNA helicase [Agyrium rufum]|nr:3'-5' DNA helicase [Agyrium rufum]
MSSSADEFGGDFDEEDFLEAATQAERNLEERSEFPEPIRKRRRLHHNSGGCQASSDNSIRNGGSQESEDDVDNEDDEVDLDKVEAWVEPEKTRSKYRIHIPKHVTSPKTSFLTQVPQSTQEPHRIRGAIWKKPSPHSPPSPPSPRRQMLEVGPRVQVPNVSACPLPGPSIATPAFSLRNSSTHAMQSLDDQRVKPMQLQVHNEPNRRHRHQEALQKSLQDIIKRTSTCQSAAQPNASQIIDVLSADEASLDTDQVIPTRLRAPTNNLKQTTLFGTQVENASSTQTTRRHNWPMANREEPPTHHKLNDDALQTWVYPTNLGKIRDYQYSIVARGLYHNLLVALPTGLGKTFIAATIMLNYFRWTKDAQIVFVAPTKPLVSQQIDACFRIAGIPRSTTTLLTGETAPSIRAEEWLEKRVFFMTPQTIDNDLKTGICDPKRIVLLVVDEAHRATGGYSYVKIASFIQRFNESFRVLALTATPGSTLEGVQEVINGLNISRVEIRTEESLDIREYVHPRQIDTILFDYTDEIVIIMDLFAKSLQPLVDELRKVNATWINDPIKLTPYGCTKSRQSWMLSDAGKKASMGLKGMVNNIFTILASLSHSIELLKFHGISPFYRKVCSFRQEKGDGKGGRWRNVVLDSEHFRKMMGTVEAWVHKPEFVGHPKLEYVQGVVLKHFFDHSERQTDGAAPDTRIMIFVHYRDSAEEVARVLKRHEPAIRPHVFVGQANSQGSEGMNQKKQLEIVDKFKKGIFNTLVATSIGEEGLDIGEVDRIICYDASASPIRMLQRMGRTGRKRAGNIVVTLMKDKEEKNFAAAKDSYEKMQTLIAEGSRFDFRDDISRRIVPKGIQPIVDKRVVDIPIENTQYDSLPEPRKRKKGERAPKRPPKKFHMPDGVRTGFTSASRLTKVNDSDQDESDTPVATNKKRLQSPSLEPVPTPESVFLNQTEDRELMKNYREVGGDNDQYAEAPRLDVLPTLQRTLRPTKRISHGKRTMNVIGMLQRMHHIRISADYWLAYEDKLLTEDREQIEVQAQLRNAYLRGDFAILLHSQGSEVLPPKPSGTENRKAKSRTPPISSISLLSGDDDGSDQYAYNLDGMNQFVNDDLEDEEENEEHDSAGPEDSASSATSTSFIISRKRNRSHQIASKSLSDTIILGSDDDLPDLDTLIGPGTRNNATYTSLIGGDPAASDDDLAVLLKPMQRRGKRMVWSSEQEED